MSELWDDSVLIKAFNSARAKYKDMHGSIGTSKSNGQKTYNGDTEIVGLECKHSMVATSDQEKLERDEVLQETEAPELESLVMSEQKYDVPLVGNTLDKTCMYGNEGHPSALHQASTGYPTDWRGEDRQQILSQLQQLAEQQQNLEQQLASVGNPNLEGATTSAAAWNSYPSSQNYYDVQQQAYHTCATCYWNTYYCAFGSSSSLPSAHSWSNEPQCKYCSPPNNSFVNNHCEATEKPSGTSSTSQKLPDASTLPEMVRVAVMEAMKASDAQKHTAERSQHLHSDFSDVAVAWFLAGFHTSRFLSRGRESQ